MDMAKEQNDPEIWQQARAMIFAANRADTDAPLPLFQNYLWLKYNRQAISDNDFEGLKAAWYRLPQYSKYHLALVGEAVDRQLYQMALTLLKPLVNDPHKGDNQALRARYDELQNKVDQLADQKQTELGSDSLSAAQSKSKSDDPQAAPKIAPKSEKPVD